MPATCSQMIAMLSYMMRKYGDIPVVVYDQKTQRVVPAEVAIVHEVSDDDNPAKTHKELSICM